MGERAYRVAEFDELFAGGLRGVERRTATELELTLDSAAEAIARELVAREAECCSFFGFAFGAAGDEGVVLLRVTVPAAQVGVLDGLAARAGGLVG
jgi:hypothetical protein